MSKRKKCTCGKENRKQVTLYLSPRLVKRLKIGSVLTCKEMSEIAESAIDTYLGVLELGHESAG